MDLHREKVVGRDAKKIEDLAEMFLMERRTLSRNTLSTYRYALKNFVADMPPNVEQICVEMVEKYIMKKQMIWKGSSVNLHINAIKSFYKWLSRYGEKNIGAYLTNVDTLPPKQRILSREEYEAVCSAFQSDDYRLLCFKFICNTGLRATEFMTLRRENIANGFLRVIGKGRRRRSIPLNKTALSIAKEYPDFSYRKSKSRIWLHRQCKYLARDSGVDTFSAHSCRHYFANELYHKGVDMFTISRLLGHADTKVTENVYVHWTEENLTGITDILES